MKRQLKSLLLALALGLPSLSISSLAAADTFPCNPSTTCATTLANVQPALIKQGINWDKETDAFSFLGGLNLTNEQRNTLSGVLDNQFPKIYANLNDLNTARALLREMALSKHYDDAIARIATERIAKSTATLAILQAEREFKIFALLTPEQTKQYEALKAKDEARLM